MIIAILRTLPCPYSIPNPPPQILAPEQPLIDTCVAQLEICRRDTNWKQLCLLAELDYGLHAQPAGLSIYDVGSGAPKPVVKKFKQIFDVAESFGTGVSTLLDTLGQDFW